MLKGKETLQKKLYGPIYSMKGTFKVFCFFFICVYAMNIKKHITEDCTSFSLLIFKKKDVEMLARKPFKTLTHIILKSFSIDKKIRKG